MGSTQKEQHECPALGSGPERPHPSSRESGPRLWSASITPQASAGESPHKEGLSTSADLAAALPSGFTVKVKCTPLLCPGASRFQPSPRPPQGRTAHTGPGGLAHSTEVPLATQALQPPAPSPVPHLCLAHTGQEAARSSERGPANPPSFCGSGEEEEDLVVTILSL